MAESEMPTCLPKTRNGVPLFVRGFKLTMGNVLHSSKTLTFVVMSAVYFAVYQPFRHYPPQTLQAGLLKMLPIWSLAVYVIPSNKPVSHLPIRQRWTIYGLLISSIGDLCLIWRESLFVLGMLWFAAAHLCYLRAFWSQSREPVQGRQSRSLPMYIVLAVGACSFISQTVPGSVMPYLVMLYSLLLLTVSWRATVCFEYQRTGKSLSGCLGTIAFLLSDSMIGIDRWVAPIPLAEGLVMVTYYVAQYGIAVSAA